MKIGKTPDKPYLLMGPSFGNYALDIPAAQDASSYAVYLASQVQQEVLIAEERVTALEPPTIVLQPITSIDYSSFPSIEIKDAVFTTTPVVRLKSGTEVADQNIGTLAVIDVTYQPFMDNAWTGAVGTVVGTHTALGTGAYNTSAWESVVTEWGAHSRIVMSLNFDSFTDWYIPSVDELSEIYANLASFPNLTQAITDTLLTVACSSSEAVAPDDDTDVQTVDMTDGTVANALKLNQTTVEAGGEQGAVIPVRAQNSATVVAVGDAGEALDTVVFDVDFCMQNGFSGSAGTAVGTGDLIGDGPDNQTLWTAAVTEPLAHCNIVDGITFGSKNDWFIPSHDELIEIYNNLASFPILDAAVTATELDIVCSSSEADAPDDDTELKTVEFSTGVTVNTVNKLTLADVDAGTPQGAVIPVRVIEPTAGTVWTSQTPVPSNDWTSVTYGGGMFVAVARSGAGNRVMTSPDGITWTSRTSPADNYWISVTYGGGLFVAVAYITYGGGLDRVMTSPDGITWTLRTAASNNDWRSVTYGGGMFVAVSNTGTGDRVMTSPDGITWTSRTSAADNNWYGVTYGGGMFVAVADTGTGNRVMTSPDGVTWTSRVSAADNDWRSVTYGGGLFVAVASTGVGDRVMTMTSPDGITWTSRTAASNFYWISVTYGGGLFVAVSAYPPAVDRVMTSSADVFNVGDAGPGGGIVFYDAGSLQVWGRYLEAVDGWWRALEALDSVDGAWHYDLTEYSTFDADERFYPAGALDVYPYDGTGNWRVYPTAGICTFSDVGINSTLWFVNEIVLSMRAKTVSSGLQGPLQQVVVSGLAAP